MTEMTEQERWAKTCGSKAQFESKDETLKYGEKLNEDYRQDKSWEAYRCPYCEMWHLSEWRL